MRFDKLICKIKGHDFWEGEDRSSKLCHRCLGWIGLTQKEIDNNNVQRASVGIKEMHYKIKVKKWRR